jgi:hypothetical protein
MAVTFDVFASASATAASLTYAHAVTAGLPNPILIVGVGVRDATANRITGVTYNAVAMVAAGSAQDNTTASHVYYFYLFNPASGSNSVVITAAASEPMTAVSASYSRGMGVGVSGGATPGAVTNTSVTLTVQRLKGLMVAVANKKGNFTTTWTGVTGGTLRGQIAGGSGANKSSTGLGELPLTTNVSTTTTLTSADSGGSTIFALEIFEMSVRIMSAV